MNRYGDILDSLKELSDKSYQWYNWLNLKDNDLIICFDETVEMLSQWLYDLVKSPHFINKAPRELIVALQDLKTQCVRALNKDYLKMKLEDFIESLVMDQIRETASKALVLFQSLDEELIEYINRY